jgi:hypothetical protein
MNKSGRLHYLIRMMKVLNVHSSGRMIPNMPTYNYYGHQFILDTISKCKFTVAFENAIAKLYVTEKFYDPLIAGSVPVYLGAPNIADFAPGENCFINASGWESPESLARYLLEVAQDESLYCNYLEWKEKPFLPIFAGLLGRLKEHPFRRLRTNIEEII